jgi:hypothetical protein
VERQKNFGVHAKRKRGHLLRIMAYKAARVIPLLDEFRNSDSPGARLSAIAVLQTFPNEQFLNWLAERLDNPGSEKPFVGYQAAVALLEGVRTLPQAECAKIRTALERAMSLAQKMPDDPDRLQY